MKQYTVISLLVLSFALLSACGENRKSAATDPDAATDSIPSVDAAAETQKPSYPIYELKKGEGLTAFAKRLLPDSCELEGNPISAKWNDKYILITAHKEYDPDTTYQSYQYYYFMRTTLYIEITGDHYRKLFIDGYGPEGGNAVIESFFFANADDDPEKELLTIVSWRQKHYDVEGHTFQTYVYDDKLPASEGMLTELQNVSEKLDGGCDCSWRDGKTEQAKYKTAAEVKKRLKELGF